MHTPPDLRCPCGVAAPPSLPPPGAAPSPCVSCGTPLVRPGPIAAPAVERAFAGALVAGALCAVGWMGIVRATGSEASYAVAAAGAVIGAAAWGAARVRGTGVQVAAGLGVVAFLLLGEFLIYRQALEPWLIRLHEAEGAGPDAPARAVAELSDMDLSHFVHLATSMSLFVGLAFAFAGALWMTRAPGAVAAFEGPPPPAPPAVPEALPAASAGPAATARTLEEPTP